MTTRTTVVNVTNHTYFNLGDTDTIADHWVKLPSKRYTGLIENYIQDMFRTPCVSAKHLPSDRRIFSANVYTEVDRALIPTGRVAGVQGTPLDLTKSTQLGKVVHNPINTNCPQGVGHVSWRRLCWLQSHICD